MQIKNLVRGASVAALSLVPMLAAAQFSQTPPNAPVVGNTYGGVIDIFKTISGWMLGILIALAVIFLIYAAFLYLTSGGEQESLTRAKNFLVYALIAIGVGLLARGLVILAGTLFAGGNNPIN